MLFFGLFQTVLPQLVLCFCWLKKSAVREPSVLQSLYSMERSTEKCLTYFWNKISKSFVKFFILSKNHYLGFLILKYGKLRSFLWSRNPEVLLVVFWSHLGIVYDGFYGHQSQWVASIFDFRIFDKLEIILDIESSQPIGLMSLFW